MTDKKWLHAQCPVCGGGVPVGLDEEGKPVILLHHVASGGLGSSTGKFRPSPGGPSSCEGSGKPVSLDQCQPRDRRQTVVVTGVNDD